MDLKLDKEESADQLVNNKAQWHKSCHDKLSKDRLARTEKKRERENACCRNTEDLPESKRPIQRQPQEKHMCIFCKQINGNLHEFHIFKADETVRCIATDLQVTSSLSTVVAGDLITLEAK